MSALSPAPTSSWIAFHGYSNGTMTLITKTGESYAAKIPESRYSDFLKAPSMGSFFNIYIKPFATVTKVDVTEDVALVEKAKDRIAMDAKFSKALGDLEKAVATPSPVAVPKKGRKAPAKSLLPNKPYVNNGYDAYSAWLDFRCLADSSTDVALANTLRAYLKGDQKGGAKQHLPTGYYSNGVFNFMSAYGSTKGSVAAKYVKGLVDNPLFAKGPNGPREQLANAYRAAYRSWVRREEAKKAKVPTKADILAAAFKEVFDGGFTGTETVTAKVAPSKQVVTVPVGVDQKRVDAALQNLVALENGQFYVTISDLGTTQVKLIRGSLVFAHYAQRR